MNIPEQEKQDFGNDVYNARLAAMEVVPDSEDSALLKRLWTGAYDYHLWKNGMSRAETRFMKFLIDLEVELRTYAGIPHTDESRRAMLFAQAEKIRKFTEGEV